ncbi:MULTISPECIES: slipin family protein [Dyella]|uniref:slipin family protein n=1 Tax=Dyella TaxID=231454 RepID=UPI001EFD5960|nr:MULTISPECIES: slipin family protein [Dyella]MDR3446696.1 slipin family protein [Dyella sp.]ULU23395.1 slipin family protein [Dyella terrae]
MNAITLFIVVALTAVGGLYMSRGNLGPAIGFWVIAAIASQSLKMANTWQKFVVLRAGKLLGVRGPGLFLIIPVLDHVVAVIDERIQTTAFNAEQALTRDTVPVNVDAIIFWHVHDARKAALAITDYQQAIARVAQTSLREMIGSSMLASLLSDRQSADLALCTEIGRKTLEWGLTVRSVEIRDVAIPVALQDAMSRQAQAEREKQARIILGSAEAEIASKFVSAAKIYADQPTALQLRAMNIIYETTKERGTTILIPSSMVDSMNPASATALALAARSAAMRAEEQHGVAGELTALHTPIDTEVEVDHDAVKTAEWSLARALNNLISEGGYALASDDATTPSTPSQKSEKLP